MYLFFLQDFHDVFFKLSSRQKMNIIKVDREILAQKEFRETTTGLEAAGKKKRRSASRLSAVTMAKLQQRQQIQQLLSENSSSKDQNSN